MQSILYIIPCFPKISETFIMRELSALKKKQYSCIIYALKNEYKANHLNFPVIYRYQIGILRWFVPMINITFKNPSLFLFTNIKKYINKPLYMIILIRNLVILFALMDVINRNQITRIHAHFGDIGADLGCFLRKMTGLPLSLSLHAHDVFVGSPGLKWKTKQADAVFVCSRFLNRFLFRTMNIQSAHTIYHGLDFTDPVWDRIYQSRIKEFIYSRDEPARLLAVGRLVPKKGFHFLLKALKVLKDDGFSFTCHIIGDGPYKTQLDKDIQKYAISDRVKLTGTLPFNEIQNYYKEAHILLCPSIRSGNGDQDNIPNVIIEAMAFGVPVLASNLESIQEVVKNNHTGFIANPEDPRQFAAEVKRILSHPDKMNQTIRTANQYIKDNFDINRNVDQMIIFWNSKDIMRMG